MTKINTTPETTTETATGTKGTELQTYEAPRVTKKRSVSKVTLFSGGGATAGGLTAAG